MPKPAKDKAKSQSPRRSRSRSPRQSRNAYLVWSQSEDTQYYCQTQCLGLAEEALETHLTARWRQLDGSEHQHWLERAKQTMTHWIQDNVVKRCARHSKWRDGTVMVAKCREDGLWYLADANYHKGTHVEGDWPKTPEGQEAPQYQVSLYVKWTENGLRLSFRHNPNTTLDPPSP